MATYPAVESRFTPAIHSAGGLEAPDDRIALAEQLLDSAERAQSFTNATGAVIALRRGEEVIVRTSSGIAPEVGARFTLDNGIIGLCVRTEKPQECSVEAAAADPLLGTLGIRSVAAVPVRYQGAVRAVLAVFSQTPNAFHRTHVAILMTLRDVIGSSLQQAPVPLENQPEPAPKPAETLVRSAAAVPDLVSVPAPVEPDASKPAPAAVVAPPPPTMSAAELLKLVESPTPAPIAPSPELLLPGEDPSKYKAQPTTPAMRPVGLAPAVRVAAVPRSSLLETHTNLPRVHSRSYTRPVIIFVALVVVAAALGLYWGNRQPAPAAAASPALQTVPEPVAPAPAPETTASITVTAEATPPAKPAPPKAAAAAKHENTAATKLEAAPPETPAMALAPSAAPQPAPEAPGEAPALALGGSTALPALPSPKAEAPNLVVRHAVLVPAVLLQHQPPLYPQMAQRLGIQGTVKLQAAVAADGSVTNVRVISGEPMLRDASVNAVRHWRYRPATLDGKAVESVADVVLTFKRP